ncbi:asparagine synthase (glutamine-hydrolyzing) [Luteimonas mephitis]|uniref:asparagine synthase (glutamine-hydrolyzing) n=1 Tax=Luteimonas mephitis TaxID=83615 RepID=UPI003A8FF99D
MCGLAGYLGHPVPGAQAPALLQAMAATLAHRGPDGHGVHAADGIGLAHTRLSIIDPIGGEQPMANAAGDIWIAFNGEIFNFIELRVELQALGHVFRTRSDTEVVVQLYERHGDEFVERLNGQFAIALWDGNRRRLLLARDRLGIRPLYHAHAGGTLWFASEVKALFAAVPGLARLDPIGIAQAFTCWAPVDPDSVWRDVCSLPPGHLMVVEADGRSTLRQYWDWDFPDAGAPPPWHSEEAAAEELRARLAEAVRLQLRADVPVAAYLSGGLDSSAIVALARASTAASMRTFSIAFAQPELDESAHQQAMVRHLGTDHTCLRIDATAIGTAFPRLLAHLDAPILRTAPVPMMLLADQVRMHGYRVALSGEGADEVFGGYDLFKEAKVRRFWARQPNSAIRHRLLGRLYGYLDDSPVANPAFAAAFFGQGMEHLQHPGFAHLPRWTTSRRAMAFLSPQIREAAAGFDPLARIEAMMPARAARWSPMARDQYVEAKTLLAGYLLASQGDRPAMAASIEGRFPFLDHTLVEFANRLPPQWKIHGLNEKHVLRKAVADLLPPAIAARRKQPYRAPDSASFFSNGKPLDYVAELFDPAHLHDSGLVDAAAAGRLHEKARAGRATSFADNQAFVGILSLLWLQRHYAATA